MNVFIKTFVACLVVCLGYYFWLFLGKESYQTELSTNKTTMSEEIKTEKKPQAEQKEETKTKEIKIYFMTDENTTKSVVRQAQTSTLREAVEELLKGPTKIEKQLGLYSEIPTDTKLMWVKNEDGKIIVNLTKNFENGGGTKSIENRIKQLKMTIDNFGSKKPVYLYLDGKQVEYMGGEGIYIEQPLN